MSNILKTEDAKAMEQFKFGQRQHQDGSHNSYPETICDLKINQCRACMMQIHFNLIIMQFSL